MAQRNKRIKVAPVDRMAGYCIQERDDILDDLVTWRTWAAKSCEKAGNFLNFKKALQYDREHVLRQMECLGMETILMDLAAWLMTLDEHYGQSHTPNQPLRGENIRRMLNINKHQRAGKQKSMRRNIFAS